MIGHRDVLALSFGLFLGMGGASLYWHSAQKRIQFIFDHNLKCTQIGRQFESENKVAVLKVTYSPTRNSCVAEVAKPYSGGMDYIVEDLLSGDTMFYKRTKAPEILDDQTLKEQEAKFVALSK